MKLRMGHYGDICNAPGNSMPGMHEDVPGSVARWRRPAARRRPPLLVGLVTGVKV
jgi:hypothetical protein